MPNFVDNLVSDFAKEERQWKRHVRIKYARHLTRSPDIVASRLGLALLQRYGVRDNGSVLPSTTDQLERSIRNDERAASTKVAVAEVSKE